MGKLTERENGLVWRFCDWAFYNAKTFLPMKLRETTRYDMALAFGFGILGGYYLAWGGKAVLEAVNIPVEPTAKYSLAATWGGLVVPKVLAPQHFDMFREDHPVYSWGVFGSAVGGTLKALEVLVL